ncbi:hypothetical protein OC25_23800 [Pedobacter kyungheensis]|uniref:Uncharacterized protein n=1 Tax=Pedobacter kyungheensis TaxID=1069985 RepID=A0A0C1FCY6_9SPHI|nr:hypothetical protein OC25_23800 [Pedobacter kyungheensis]
MDMITKSVIISDFKGFPGRGIFKLQNGEIWEQDGHKYQYFYIYRPTVIIEHNGSKGIMTVNGHECKVKKIS